MSDDASHLLDRLAAACGIAPDYADIWGRRRVVPEASKRAILAAMGLDVGSEAALRRAILAREAATWGRPLPAALVVHEVEGAVEVPLRIAESRAERPLDVRLETERGERFEWKVTPRELHVTERAEVDGVRYARHALRLAPAPAPGYHRLELGGVEAATRLIVAPACCFLPEGLAGDGRVWGPAVQLYALRSGRDWGVGDFGDLEQLVREASALGAGLVGLNPLHALFFANPRHCGPYSPSSRSFLNWIYLDVERIPELAECEPARRLVASSAFQARLVALRQGDRVDYAGVAAAKREVLELVWDHFRRGHLQAGTPRGRAFRAFLAERGPQLAAWGVFEALDERFRAEGAWGWPVWPEAYRRRDSSAVRQFVEERRDRVEFFQWLQWECDRQLATAGRLCFDLGLKLGLYEDLAVSVDRAGFETWYWSDVFAVRAGIGAPPDDFNLRGQNWGLPPWIPERLRESGFQPFIDCLRANMRHAGALRIDHVMGLMRSFWVPPGGTAAEGSYVGYPFEDLLGILKLESVRNRCLVIGEDLGTVPDEVRAALAPAGVLSYRLFYFMRQGDGGFAPPAEYPRQTLVAISTHDLPTLAGWWQGRDLSLRSELGLFPEDRQYEQQLAERSRDRAQLLFALRREELLGEEVDLDLAHFPEALTPELVVAIHRYLARSPAAVLTFQLEDAVGQLEQANLPGTTDEHPNWQRRLAADLGELARDGRLLALAAGLRRERGEGRVDEAEARRRALAARGGACRIPESTYRLQFHREFTFARAAELVPYLAALGVSHVYASPLLQARPGSRHGYDVIDHGRLDSEIGSTDEFEQLVATLRRHEMGLVLDIVPNHMGVGSDNGWWMSVLEHGPASPYASFFDIDWRPHKRELWGKVLLPVLEDHYGRVLERGLLRLSHDPASGRLEIAYHEHRFPIDPATYGRVLSLDLERLRARLGANDPRFAELLSLIAAFDRLPGRDTTDPEAVEARLRDAEVLRRQLVRLAAPDGGEAIATFVAANVGRFNGDPDDPCSVDLLDELLGAQAYRLAFWRTANDEINYRRFFDINDLAAVRVEEPAAFEATHRLVLDLVRRGRIDGLRVDHPDGLYDPAGYFRRLAEELGGPDAGGAPPVWTVAEKILASYERLRDDLIVHGTSGYEFCNLVGGLFVDPAGERPIDRVYHRFLGRRADYDALLHDSKRLILDTALGGELTVLADDLNRLSESDRRTRDFTHERLRRALAEVIAWFPVYRTYVDSRSVTDEDRRYVDWAVARARGADRAIDTSVYDFIRDVLVLEAAEGKDEHYRRAVVRFASKFQQTTSPVMAKGLEDTTFYRYNRLLALNEVGGEPRRFGVSPSQFHRANLERRERWPHAMLTSSTHDSKRSEDARARIAVLSEIPDRWARALRRWSTINRRHKTRIDRRTAPDRNDEYALYQTLLAVWPGGPPEATALDAVRARVREWAVKAIREAKQHSSWIRPDEAYERAVVSFVEAILDGPEGLFVRELAPLARFVAAVGALGSLSQLVLKLTSPGVPDIYQGNETIEPTLVDPDNRRTPDFSRRRSWLEELEQRFDAEGGEIAARAAELGREVEDGRAKLYVTWKLLRLRRSRPELFRDGTYRPLEVAGAHAEHVVAYARESGEPRVAVVVPRLVAPWCDPLSGRLDPDPAVWADTRVALPGAGRNLFTGEPVDGGGETVEVGRLLRSFPVAAIVC